MSAWALYSARPRVVVTCAQFLGSVSASDYVASAVKARVCSYTSYRINVPVQRHMVRTELAKTCNLIGLCTHKTAAVLART